MSCLGNLFENICDYNCIEIKEHIYLFIALHSLLQRERLVILEVTVSQVLRKEPETTLKCLQRPVHESQVAWRVQLRLRLVHENPLECRALHRKLTLYCPAPESMPEWPMWTLQREVQGNQAAWKIFLRKLLPKLKAPEKHLRAPASLRPHQGRRNVRAQGKRLKIRLQLNKANRPLLTHLGKLPESNSKFLRWVKDMTLFLYLLIY